MASSARLLGSDDPSDIQIRWKQAVIHYEALTGNPICISSDTQSISALWDEVSKMEIEFRNYRHDGSKIARFRSSVAQSLDQILQLGDVVAQATKAVRCRLRS